MRFATVASDQKVVPLLDFEITPGIQTTRTFHTLAGPIHLHNKAEPATCCGAVPMATGINASDFYVLDDQGTLHRCMATSFSFSNGQQQLCGLVLSSEKLDKPEQYKAVVDSAFESQP